MIGKRVQVPAWSDCWMRGDRYGEVISDTRTFYARNEDHIYRIKLDKSGRVVRFFGEDLEVLQ